MPKIKVQEKGVGTCGGLALLEEDRTAGTLTPMDGEECAQNYRLPVDVNAMRLSLSPSLSGEVVVLSPRRATAKRKMQEILP